MASHEGTTDSKNGILTNAELNDVISKTVNHVMNESWELTSETSHSSKRRAKNDNQVRRPMNAFMVYAQVARKKVARKYPNLSYRKLSKTLGELWRMLDDEERRPFIEEADRLRQEHKRAHPTYKFKPQRRRKKTDKQTEPGKPQFVGPSAAFMSTSGQMMQPGSYLNEYNSPTEALPFPYLPRNESNSASVSTIWPFMSNNASEPYVDSNSNINKGFPSVSTITASTSVNFPNQRQYFDSTGYPTKQDLTRQNVCSQNTSVMLPEQSSHFRGTKFLNEPNPSNTLCFSETYPPASSIDNNMQSYHSDVYDLSSRGISPFSRSPPVITSALSPSNPTNTPYNRNVFPEMRASRNEPSLTFMDQM